MTTYENDVMVSNQTQNCEKKKLSILNPNNALINPQIISNILAICELNYKVNDLNIFQKGFTHKSYIVINNPEVEYEIVSGCIELQNESNERLEYLGDAVMGSIVSSYLFHRYPSQNEGFLTKLKTKLVRTKMLAQFATHLGLTKYLLISKHVEDICNGRINERILEDTFEAFVGALFEDNYMDNLENYGKAMQICNDFIVFLMEETVDFRELISVNDNFKEQLLQLFQKNFGGKHPIYHIIGVDGPTNNRIYTMGVNHPKIPNLLIGKGLGRKKNEAEQLASKNAMEYLEKNPNLCVSQDPSN
jgi:ribonuclease-3